MSRLLISHRQLKTWYEMKGGREEGYEKKKNVLHSIATVPTSCIVPCSFLQETPPLLRCDVEEGDRDAVRGVYLRAPPAVAPSLLLVAVDRRKMFICPLVHRNKLLK